MRVALGIEYDGSGFCGWQRQLDVDSVQAQLEKALSYVANEPIKVLCAGRTDTGVHATGQVVHFDTNVQRPMTAWTLGVNANLPDSIAVRWMKEVDDSFHARYSATARRYRYVIYNHQLRPGILASGVSHYHGDIDETLMHQAAQLLVGKHDFTSFRALHCQAKTPCRDVHQVNVTRQGMYVLVDIQANAFLHHMVRNIVGSLLQIGLGNQSIEWITELLALKNRTQAAATAKPNGLYLVDVTYPEQHQLPRLALGPLFMLD
ncbi:MAG: tRNA pseudouridine(38-40) synthase TruA [Shewanella psychromarinicola]|jgi:tRNA pseudouridine38-40 synthase|uniref:tRNA pseudouridine synthase A n=1 Tax=Shewanella psychromarinicola TaxID=2487742 RepID=A0A3N4ECP1_9GAMM|nr:MULTISPECIES: tRNA pseudouridine(38-40) synthase TruA [Shewanella]AZG36813.1 tRNA pseudouridine(38-40) synthase TruA [Shewanella psychromarinicola]MCL1081067.1 tRNA pseudouridine(38-40) synthase TruA [Shewanella psychromarinicola]PKG78058.1 tRNA pseudouridine(38-40) synthase TruA [Shewanella sp. Actino-trap-3]RPA34667.1 tRNA pseudouridine(38-40) synthase TruA [Shewanella psychromarinicola]|tara:strand:+ start:187898 stop:188683 length:786 start_codon:yes stop_codon:yes gene_type:complete